MKRLILIFIFIFSLLHNGKSQSWQTVGVEGFSAGQASFQDVITDASGDIYVSYKDAEVSNKISVQKFDGTSWSYVGTQGFSMNTVNSTSITIGGDGVLYAAFGDYYASNKLSIMKFNGTDWVYSGSQGLSSGTVYDIDMATDPNGVPYIIYKDDANSGKASVLKYNGTIWSFVGSDGFTGGSATGTKIAFDSNAVPYIAFTDGQLDSRLTVMKYTGGFWQQIGVFLSEGVASHIDIALDGNDIPHVIYKDAGDNNQTSVLKFSSSTWSFVGIQGSGIGATSLNNIKFDLYGRPVIVYQNSFSLASSKRFDGNSWVSLGGTFFSAGTANDIEMTINNNGNYLAVFKDASQSQKATVKKFIPAEILGDTIYVNVNASGNNDGTSWTHAYTSLKTAINTSMLSDEIWVAAGTYRPDFSRTIAFDILADSLEVYGGFAGGETHLGERNWNINKTILSGDVDFDDSHNLQNAQTIVKVFSPNYALLDGLIITGGYAEGTSGYSRFGAGIYVTDAASKVEIRNCTIEDNEAAGDAGIYTSATASDKEVNIINCKFVNNTARWAASYGFRSNSGRTINVNIVNCLFAGNSISNNLGAGSLGSCGSYRTVEDASINAKQINCTYTNNVETGTSTTNEQKGLIFAGHYTSGGADLGNINIETDNCIFWNNSIDVPFNQGTYPYPCSSITVNNSISESFITGATTTSNNVLVTDPLFENSANNFMISPGSPAIDAGDISGFSELVPSLDLAGNPRVYGGTIDIGCFELNGCGVLNDVSTSFNGTEISLNQSGASYQWLDCGNNFTEIDGEIGQSFTPAQDGVYSCEITNGCAVDTTICIDVCSVTNITTTTTVDTEISVDQAGATYQWLNCNDGNSEIIGEEGQTFTAVENGAYACEITNGCDIDTTDCVMINTIYSIVYVNNTASGNNNGTSWSNAYNQLFDAINNAQVNDHIWVAAGTYLPVPNPDRLTPFYVNTDSLHIYGGFAGNETDFSQRDWRNNETILSGAVDGDAGFTNNSYTVLRFASPNFSLIDGVTITEGYAQATSGNQEIRGGAGVYIDSQSKKINIENCKLTGNRGVSGGALYCYSTAGTIELNITNCIFENNDGRYGGGFYIRANGGAQIDFNMSNTLCVGNKTMGISSQAALTGPVGFIRTVEDGTLNSKITNCTFAGNVDLGTVVSEADRAILWIGEYTTGSTDIGLLDVQLVNSIFWGNSIQRPIGKATSQFSANSILVDNTISELSIVGPSITSQNNSQEDPLFTNDPDNFFTLQATSPAIDAGSITGFETLIPDFDLLGNPRISNGIIDLGCYENTPCAETVTLTTFIEDGDIYCDQAGAEYQWLDCDDGNAVINGETSQNFSPIISGNYACEVTKGCVVDTTNCVNVIISNVNRVSSEISLTIYPNPASTLLSIKTPNDNISNISIYDITGKSINVVRSGINKVDVSHLPNGIYIIEITEEEQTLRRRFVKK